MLGCCLALGGSIWFGLRGSLSTKLVAEACCHTVSLLWCNRITCYHGEYVISKARRTNSGAYSRVLPLVWQVGEYVISKARRTDSGAYSRVLLGGQHCYTNPYVYIARQSAGQYLSRTSNYKGPNRQSVSQWLSRSSDYKRLNATDAVATATLTAMQC